jgi:hypothetical protein
LNTRSVRRNASGSQACVVDPATCRHTWYVPTDPPFARRYFTLSDLPHDTYGARCRDCGCIATLHTDNGRQRIFWITSPFPIVIDVTKHEDATCRHGRAWDMHCCNCHSGFLFDVALCVCHDSSIASKGDL